MRYGLLACGSNGNGMAVEQDDLEGCSQSCNSMISIQTLKSRQFPKRLLFQRENRKCSQNFLPSTTCSVY